MKVVINKCYGGFSLSRVAWFWLREQGFEEAVKKPLVPGEAYEDGTVFTEKNDEMYGDMRSPSCQRNDPMLIKCVETLGIEAASGHLAELKIVEIPDDVEWEITDYDGIETLREVSRIFD